MFLLMTSHPVVAQRNRGTLPGRDQWRMALWAVLSISNPRRTPGQGNSLNCLFVSLLCWPTQPQMSHFALISITSDMFLYHLLSIQCKTAQPTEMQSIRTAKPATEGFICCQPSVDAIRLYNVTTEHKQCTTRLFREEEFVVFHECGWW